MCGYQEEKDWQWKQAMDYLSAVTELNYMTQIVIMLYEDNDKVSRQRAAELKEFFCQFDEHVSLCLCCRSRRQRSVSTWSFTSAQESKGVRMRRMFLWASASAQPPPRCVNFSGFNQLTSLIDETYCASLMMQSVCFCSINTFFPHQKMH